MNTTEYIVNLCKKAKQASRALVRMNSSQKNDILNTIADRFIKKQDFIQAQNQKDLDKAGDYGLTSAMVDRLTLTTARVKGMAECVREVAALPDPVGSLDKMWVRPNGLKVGIMRVPIGVVGIIYESRPNVTSDAAALCFKSSNAVILRGGKEAFFSNQAIVAIIQEVLEEKDVPKEAVSFIADTDRELVQIFLKQDESVDLVIPRGGRGLIEAVVNNSRIPVIKHYDGICHIYVDNQVDKQQATDILLNAKVQRPGVCNAMETLLINKDIANEYFGPFITALQEKNVKILGCEQCMKLASQNGLAIEEATEEDWKTEYVDYILSVKIVDGIEEAVEHINTYGSHHTDAILSTDYFKTKQFIEAVDSACVFANASTRFSDGHEFGLGAEIGISTNKLHARGPMGLEDLTTRKYIAIGENHCRN